MDRYGPRARRALVLLVLAGCTTALPSAAPSSAPPSGSSTAAPEASFRADAIRLVVDLAALQAIADGNGGIRAVGTPGFDASVEWAADELASIGFDVERPEVAFTGFRELPGSMLEVGQRTFDGAEELHALIYSPGGDVRGPVALLREPASGCAPEDFAGVAPGSIVMTTRGGCFRRDQAVNAAAAGAVALLVGYPGRGPGEIYRPTLLDPGGIDIPVVSVTDEAVRAIEAAEGREVRLSVETEREPAVLRNVVGQLGDGPSVVMLGAHLDSVLDGPGMNDDGSGVVALLEVARAVAEVGVPEGWAVRIGFWGGEEFGTIGSRAYADGLGDEVVAYLNLDMAGSVNGATLVYDEEGAAEGSDRIAEAYEAWFAARGEETERVDLGGSSDHSGFMAAGIPTGGLFAGASETGSAANPSAPGGSGVAPDPCYHVACDDVDNVDVERVALFAEATFAVAYRLMEP